MSKTAAMLWSEDLDQFEKIFDAGTTTCTYKGAPPLAA